MCATALHCTVCRSARGGDPLLPLAVDLARRCLEPNPHTRLTAEDALAHPFMTALSD